MCTPKATNTPPPALCESASAATLGQRALNRPTILVTNQHSLSDAEDFTEGYRTLRLGQVVGEPTAGWIIYTWNQSLIDGTTFRLPRMKVTAKKAGYQSSSIWLQRSGFEAKDGKMVKRVYLTLKADGEAP